MKIKTENGYLSYDKKNGVIFNHTPSEDVTVMVNDYGKVRVRTERTIVCPELYQVLMILMQLSPDEETT